MHRPDGGQQRGDDLARDLGIESGVLEIAAVQHRIDAELVAHGGDVAGDGAIAERDEDAGAGADDSDAVQVLFARDGAFHQGDVHVFGKLFAIHQRAPDDLGALGEGDEPLIGIEQGHMAAGAAVEPDGGEADLAVGALICGPPASC